MELQCNEEADQKSVLIVEDEAILRLVVVEALSNTGLAIHEAGDGARALDVLNAHPSIALLISDIKMPGMSGYELAEKALARSPGLKIILMTGYSRDPVPESMRRAGAQVLYKPFDLEKLCTLARDLISA